MTNIYIALESVGFTLPDGTPLFTQLNESFDSRHTGLVGRNGVGKSVLAQILAGKTSPSSGRCIRSGSVYYLAQQVTSWADKTVAELAGVGNIIAALERIEMGSVSPLDFDTVGNRWDIRQQLQHELERCGLGYLEASTPAQRLSGGESMRVSLIGAWLSEADFLILDEPSNHLDRAARQALTAQLQRWPGGLVVVSHDRDLLQSLSRIVELSSQGLSSYGGNYSLYAQLKAQETQATLQQYELRKRERQREQKALREQKERHEKRQARGNRQGREANQAKILLGGQKQRSEASAGKLHQQHAATLSTLDQRVREAANQVEENAAIVVHSLAVSSPSRRQICQLKDVQLPFVANFVTPLNLTLTAQQRVGVVGNNGCGKSTLLKVLAGKLQPLAGECQVVEQNVWSHINPIFPGAKEHAFDVDQLESAARFEQHLNQLAQLPESDARNTVVVCGGGFTGIELATELPARLRAILGERASTRVIIADRSPVVGGRYSEELSAVITQASEELGVEWKLNAEIAAIDAQGVTFRNGDFIASNTVVMTMGVQASPLTSQIPATRDAQGRLHVDENLKVVGQEDIYATGDVAFARTDDLGNTALMTCQHAIMLGRFVGNNVAAELLGVAPHPYRQVNYVTCLDLGGFGAVYTEGWDQVVKSTRSEGKKIKVAITNELIYPPKAEKEIAFAAADPLAAFV